MRPVFRSLFPLCLSVLISAGLFMAPAAARADDATGAEIIVYGSTPAGFCAAIAAAREGRSVLLLEPSDHVGGVNTGGLSFSDSNQTVRSTVMGLFHEWHTRIEKEYQARGITLPYQVSVKDHSSWTYEPSVAQKITREMLDEAKVRVLSGRRLLSVKKDGATLRQVETTQGSFEGKVFIDATYEGDLMAASGVSWTIGREGRADFGESYAGKQYPKPRMAISGFADDGSPLPLITTTDAGDEAAGDKNVMVYSFRLCLTREAANRVPFPAPAKYDPARFEAIRRWYAQEKKPVLLWDLYPLPNGKFDANNGIGKQFSMGLVGAASGWCESGPEDRAALWEAHKQYTLELYHFLTTDPAVPEALRQQLGELGLCRDEFPATGHWSPQLYVREGRRLQGLHFLSQKDIFDHPEKEDPIAVSSFPIDSHDCQRVALPGPEGGVINEGTIYPVRLSGRRHGPAYHIPYRSVLPQASEATNLLVPVALSCTHVVFSSVRVEPTWMILGQSTGIAAALAAARDVAVQDLPYAALKERLLAQGQVLELPVLPPPPPESAGVVSLDPAKLPGLVLDDSQAMLEGSWAHSTGFKPHIGSGYRHDDHRSDGQSRATFRFQVPQAGRYRIGFAYSAHPTRATNVPVRVTAKAQGLDQAFTLDETRPLPPGEPFRVIGEVSLPAGEEVSLSLSNQGTDGFVILDGVQLTRVEAP